MFIPKGDDARSSARTKMTSGVYLRQDRLPTNRLLSDDITTSGTRTHSPTHQHTERTLARTEPSKQESGEIPDGVVA